MSGSDEAPVTTLKLKRPAPPAAPRVFDVGEAPAPSGPLAARLAEMRARYDGLTGGRLLEVMIRNEFPERIAVVSSFGSESVVVLHMMAQIDPTVPVIFLNTGKLFGETLRYRDRLQDQLRLTDIRAIGPHPDDEQRDDPDGILWSQNPDACCNFRKVLPLKRALKHFDAQVTGRKRFQTSARLAMPTIEVADGRFKINPLADMTLYDLTRYIEEHKLPKHPLVDDGYLSIGCMPCTQRVQAGGDYRSGRWAGSDKEECGIHGDGI
ncbi:MAG: phosphoadenylyl-sulfate reductase [Alphaproteobacteria bacterium]|nr:phosphoadenylyl-sulfate reductase [Alphaproteobacteria bacterium]